jgi:short subunit dehydrogenase-like uncharacterized protein
VTNAKGESREATLDTLEGYQFTVEACTAIAYRILDGLPGAGAMTPSRLLGANFVQTIPGSVLTIKQCDA